MYRYRRCRVNLASNKTSSTIMSGHSVAPSLVKYNNPTLVSTGGKKGKGKGKLPPVDSKQNARSQTEDILNSILPPVRVTHHHLQRS